jgi:hypothetical protein
MIHNTLNCSFLCGLYYLEVESGEHPIEILLRGNEMHLMMMHLMMKRLMMKSLMMKRLMI